MSRPVEGIFTLRNESMKFTLQSVKISSSVRKKMTSSTYLENANLTSVSLTPSFRKSSYSNQPYGVVRDTNSLRSLANHFQLYFNRMNKLQEEFFGIQQQLDSEEKKVKNIGDCEVELRICFKSVPQVFFDAEFDLSDPVMFSVVLDPNEHFKLSGYLDLVEVCLNEQISIQSESLFSAIRQLQDFQIRVSETLQIIRSDEVRSVKQNHTIPPLLIPVYSRRISNLKKVQQLVSMLFHGYM
ncbi:vacuolar protein sorting-associated protein [Blastocystis sp. subtype 4]|uniref:vacuolar protein sorting-associated protein n=1 Tax=Blastocystis sp. subtype 4 TaxID=944170 RepID=UPI0007113275|nr:vacuolar protein sorting-associated protein [Blastocystis sp. subtype 4]KNB41766.1 vacuolar protein sorting-associated protein [Blastocystis sp. subtype 4]|eukprot:XP_014525209.1 vacuolar protein sorting-associated protein [Blastocystis sp. subtype 4]